MARGCWILWGRTNLHCSTHVSNTTTWNLVHTPNPSMTVEISNVYSTPPTGQGDRRPTRYMSVRSRLESLKGITTPSLPRSACAVRSDTIARKVSHQNGDSARLQRLMDTLKVAIPNMKHFLHGASVDDMASVFTIYYCPPRRE